MELPVHEVSKVAEQYILPKHNQLKRNNMASDKINRGRDKNKINGVKTNGFGDTSNSRFASEVSWSACRDWEQTSFCGRQLPIP